ncbi:MAG TPA: GNAT family protein [Saprospiraceae bacterium]
MMLETKRLYLRELVVEDLDHIHELHSLPETDQYNTLGIPDSIQITEQLLGEWLVLQNQKPRKSYILAIDSNEDNQFIGLMAMEIGKPNYRTAEVWYKLHSTFWEKGYATEALTRLLLFGFSDLNLHRIEAGCAVDNIASVRVLEKVGMTREGMKRKKLPIRGEWKDNYFYGILEEDFMARLTGL